jgi:hypothetical protein
MALIALRVLRNPRCRLLPRMLPKKAQRIPCRAYRNV